MKVSTLEIRSPNGSEAMQGLELCRRFFEDIGLPAIAGAAPTCLPQLAAGPVAGSHCNGNDDAISRDHGWGPAFVIWLDDSSYQRFGLTLQSLLDDLPRGYLGYEWRAPPAQASRVYEIDRFLTGLLGVAAAPGQDADWLHIPEEALFQATHWPVFYDAPSEMTRRFASLARYPEDVWLKRLSASLAWAWRWGVEYLPRMERRADWVSSAMYWSRFAEYAMKSTFLLNRQYAPYHKWLYREFTKLPMLSAEIDPLLIQGFARASEQASVAAQIIRILADAVDDVGFGPDSGATEQTHIPFSSRLLYRYARGVQAMIINPGIRFLSVYTEITPPSTRPAWGYFSFPRETRSDR